MGKELRIKNNVLEINSFEELEEIAKNPNRADVFLKKINSKVLSDYEDKRFLSLFVKTLNFYDEVMDMENDDSRVLAIKEKVAKAILDRQLGAVRKTIQVEDTSPVRVGLGKLSSEEQKKVMTVLRETMFGDAQTLERLDD